MDQKKIERNELGQIQGGNSANLAGKTTEVTKAAAELPLSEQVVKRLNDLQFCPVTKLVDLARNAKSQKIQCEAASKLLDKVAPNLKSVEIDAHNVNSGYQLNIYYSTHAHDVLNDPHNMVLSKIKPLTHQ